VLCPLTSLLDCAYQEQLYSALSVAAPADTDGPFSATEKKGGIGALLPAKAFHSPFM